VEKRVHPAFVDVRIALAVVFGIEVWCGVAVFSCTVPEVVIDGINPCNGYIRITTAVKYVIKFTFDKVIRFAEGM
jgi:hypothetical protein